MNFRPPNLIDRIINRAFGLLLKLGLGLKHNYLLEIRGRKTGKIYSTPVNVLEYREKEYLVAPRGYTQWVRNVEAGSEAALVKAGRREGIKLKAVANEAKPEILKAYLDRFKPAVQRYFPIPAGSPAEAFTPLAEKYPVFELTG
jgi:deazaflavin-dependent oxidoreductase (nitroreductase family)